MTNKEKNLIDSMSYTALLDRWRFTHVGDPLFTGDTGDYYAEVMKKKRKEIGNDAHVAASKRIGWER